MRIPGYHEVQAIQGGGESLPPGGYKCQIVKAYEDTSRNGRQMLCICLDVAEGEYKGIFSRIYKARKDADKEGKGVKWPCIMYKLSDGDALPRFKGDMKIIEANNPGYDFEASGCDENTLKGKRVGVVFREEEYERRDGSIGVSTKAAWFRSWDKAEDAPVPARKKMRRSIAETGGITPTDDDIPF